MHRLLKLVPLFISLVVIFGATLVPAETQVVQAQGGNHIIYNLYATDGYIQLADGTILYTYGFVGGREGTPAVYQNAWVAPPKAKNFVPGILNTMVPGHPCTTWQAPGTNLACEAQLAGSAQFPGPIIRAAVGDTVEIRLKNLGVSNKNAPNDPHSIHLHGLDVNAANDGVPETSVGAIPANAAMPGAGNVIVYYFSPTHAGTYMYHCHQEADIHVQMGMFGALVVYEPFDAAYSSWLTSGVPTGGGTLMGASWTKETILLLSEFDVRQHVSEQQGLGGGFNPVNYQPQYWSINGLSFPQTIHVAPPVLPAGFVGNWFTDIWLPAHAGYDPLVVGSVGAGDKVLLRVINMGFQTQPMHMHGFHGKILGSDQRAWPWAYNPTPGAGLEKNTLTIGSGETYEWLLDFSVWAGRAAESYPAGAGPDLFPGGTQSRVSAAGLPVSNTDPNAAAIPDPFTPPFTYVGGPTVGPVIPGPDANSVPGHLLTAGGMAAFNGQLFPFHNHDDYKATNNGVYPGGMFTMIATVP
jgi:FtsP/CotA-like multicopper oxidase with cupredoxin domain